MWHQSPLSPSRVSGGALDGSSPRAAVYSGSLSLQHKAAEEEMSAQFDTDDADADKDNIDEGRKGDDDGQDGNRNDGQVEIDGPSAPAHEILT
jgi:hypothetical protein